MEAEFISEIIVLMYQISLRHIPEDRKLKHIYEYKTKIFYVWNIPITVTLSKIVTSDLFQVIQFMYHTI